LDGFDSVFGRESPITSASLRSGGGLDGNEINPLHVFRGMNRRVNSAGAWSPQTDFMSGRGRRKPNSRTVSKSMKGSCSHLREYGIAGKTQAATR